MKSSQTSSATRILLTLIDYFRQESFVFFAIKESRISLKHSSKILWSMVADILRMDDSANFDT